MDAGRFCFNMKTVDPIVKQPEWQQVVVPVWQDVRFHFSCVLCSTLNVSLVALETGVRSVVVVAVAVFYIERASKSKAERKKPIFHQNIPDIQGETARWKNETVPDSTMCVYIHLFDNAATILFMLTSWCHRCFWSYRCSLCCAGERRWDTGCYRYVPSWASCLQDSSLTLTLRMVSYSSSRVYVTGCTDHNQSARTRVYWC